MKIIEALKKENIRISASNNRWVYWDNETNMWVVLEREYNAKKNTILGAFYDEEKAIDILLR